MGEEVGNRLWCVQVVLEHGHWMSRSNERWVGVYASIFLIGKPNFRLYIIWYNVMRSGMGGGGNCYSEICMANNGATFAFQFRFPCCFNIITIETIENWCVMILAFAKKNIGYFFHSVCCICIEKCLNIKDLHFVTNNTTNFTAE